MKKIIFVCLGNICRSPLAHAVMEDIITKKGRSSDFFVDSSGTGDWHIGQLADSRMRATAKKKGITITHLAQQFQVTDFDEFDYIFAMDQSNKQNMLFLDKEDDYLTKVQLFREFDPLHGGKLDVPDPYYGGIKGFEEVFEIVERTCLNIYEKLLIK